MATEIYVHAIHWMRMREREKERKREST